MLVQALLGLGFSIVWAASEEVVALTSSTFDKHIKDNKQTLVEFYAPWCGHCKKLTPEYEKAAVQLKEKGVTLAKVDATVEKDIAERYEVKGYPALFWFEDGKKGEYDGGRTADTIVQWVSSMTGPAVVETSEPAEHSGGLPRVVLHGESLAPGFEEAARSMRRKASWYFVKGASPHRVVLTHKGEGPVELTDGATDKAKVLKHLEDNALPLWGKLDGATFDRYSQSSKGIVWVLFRMEQGEVDQVGEEYRSSMVEVAAEFKSRFHFTYTDTVAFKDAIDGMLGVKDFPAIVIQKKAGDKKKYNKQGEISSSIVRAFVKDVNEGKVQPFLKSEPKPESNDQPVKVVTANTMSMVFDKQRDVMLEVYAPWCGHCKKLDPEYLKVAQKIRKEELEDILMLSKMDGTANDSPYDSFEWSGFPTLFFIKAGSEKPMLYDGERTSKGIWKYIKKHATKAEDMKQRIAARKAKVKHGGEL